MTDGVINAKVVSHLCFLDVELLTIKYRPVYLPREFSVIIISAVYSPPCANRNEALNVVYHTISDLQASYLEGAFIVVGDFLFLKKKSLF